MNLCRYTENLWKRYLSGQEEETEQIGSQLEPDIMIIGIGRHEYYENLEQFRQAFEQESKERDTILFDVPVVCCAEKKIAENVVLVCGTVAVKGRDTVSSAVVNMDSRFSVLYVKKGAVWKIAHIHQSIPYGEQKDGEYYPKTLVKQIQEVQDYAQKMEKMARNDSLTGLLNHQFFFEKSGEMAEKAEKAWCLVFDLDDFKRINDSEGHQRGDEVLRQIAGILLEVFEAKGIAGRIGGDEFAVLCTEMDSEEIEKAAERILHKVEKMRQKSGRFPGISIGAAQISKNETVKEAFRRADMKLYEVKRDGKSACCMSVRTAEDAAPEEPLQKEGDTGR